MALVLPDIILKPFASTGDILIPPQTDPNGFVNYTDGYTTFYEISLSANNPQAKAVERPIQNYLFKSLTTNAQAWQRMSIAPWYSTMPGGYDQTALVLRVDGNGIAQIFRSLVPNNISDPINTPLNWELQPTAGSVLNNIPMPSGGAAGSSARVIIHAVDFNTLGTGTYQVANDTIAAACTNLPIFPSSAAMAGVLEVLNWNDSAAGGSNVYTMQRYTNRNDEHAIRFFVNGVAGNWDFKVGLNRVQQAAYSFANLISSDGLTYTATLVPAPTSIPFGFEFRSVTPNLANQANATLNVNGAGAYPINGCTSAAVTAGEMLAGRYITLRWSASGWFIINSSAGALSVNQATDQTHAPRARQVQNGTMVVTQDTLSTTTPNAYGAPYAPGLTLLSSGMQLRCLAASTNTGPATFNPAPGILPTLPIVSAGGFPLAGGAIILNGVIELTLSRDTTQWYLTESTGVSTVAGLPVGSIIDFPVSTPPAGFLECDGSAQSRTTLPTLFGVIGVNYGSGNGTTTFNLPDARGLFTRAWSHTGTSYDAGRVLGSTQADSVRTQGNISSSTTNTLQTGSNAGTGFLITGATIPGTTFIPVGTETRPVNIAFMRCIKAFDVPANQGLIDISSLLAQVNALARMASGQQVFFNAGNFTFTTPPDTLPNSVFEIEAWAGGGGGAGGAISTGGAAGAGGSAGGYSMLRFTNQVPGTVYNVVIGAGGAGAPAATSGTGAAAGGNGGTTTFGNATVGNLIVCNGGTSQVNGGATSGASTGPVGGLASGGDLSIQGGSAGMTTNGIGGVGGAAPRGGPGGRASATGTGVNGVQPGGGGGGGAGTAAGGAAAAGGTGAVGGLIIKYR